MSKITVKRGKGNVFADLGIPDPETHYLKAQLVSRIQQVIREKNLTQLRAAELINAKQPDISRMLNGQFRDISVERLMLFLTRLGCDVNISVKRGGKPAFAPIKLEAEAR